MEEHLSKSLFDDRPTQSTLGAASTRSAAAPESPHRPGRFRWLLAGVSLILIVGALTWVVHFMPGKQAPEVEPLTAKNIVRFSLSIDGQNTAVWDKKYPSYARSFEVETEGFFDFPFHNATDQVAELGFLKTSCGCSSAEFTLVPEPEWSRYENEIINDPWNAKPGASWTWQKLIVHPSDGKIIPPGGKGFVRVAWNGRKEAGARLNLNIEMWIQPQGRPRERAIEKLQVPVILGLPIVYYPSNVDIGSLGTKEKGRAEFHLWSNTRRDVKLSLSPKSVDPSFEVELIPFSDDELKQHQVGKAPTDPHLLSGYRMVVTVHEQVGGKQLDQGAFAYAPVLLLNGEPMRAEFTAPLVHGRIRGETQIGTGEDAGRINFKSFSYKEVKRLTVPLWTSSTEDLAAVKKDPEFLEVKLTKMETNGTRTRWLLEVSVPEFGISGAFPEGSGITIRTQASPPRHVRIPVIGAGVQD